MFAFRNLSCGCIETTSTHETPARSWISRRCMNCNDPKVYIVCQITPITTPVAAFKTLEAAQADVALRVGPYEIRCMRLD